MKTFLWIYFCLIYFSAANAEPCRILSSDKKPAPVLHDGLAKVLRASEKCPQNIMALEAELRLKSWTFSTHLVANRGRFNPKLGSFSFFEAVEKTEDDITQEIFLGHFTGAVRGVIELEQKPLAQRLLIESIAWDHEKGLYNFYELIGQGTSAQWFYRGDSADALKDNQYLHRTPPASENKFGETMRCSACHNSGGPIMKELTPPYNDWWRSNRALPFEPNRLSGEVVARVNRLNDASNLSALVTRGMDKLNKSPAYQRAVMDRSWQEILRPLFCTTEINLVSSEARLKDRDGNFLVPSAFIVNPLLGALSLSFSKVNYRKLLAQAGVEFPENGEDDADHMWLSPVVGASDILAITTLIETETISREAALEILMVDFKNSVFSTKRCGLLSSVPNVSGNWFFDFKAALAERSEAHARDLLRNLTSDHSPDRYAQIVKNYGDELEGVEGFRRLFQSLLQVRDDAFANEISQNPLGQILEPGFRVIFPQKP